jgi:hypothetical protein
LIALTGVAFLLIGVAFFALTKAKKIGSGSRDGSLAA